MGLDMYLEKRTHISPKDVKKLKIGGIKGIKAERVKEITEQCIYWRKANAIHKWFVDNVQDGEDDCKEYNVDISQLKILADLCGEVLRTKDASKLPTTEGFFFGGTDYDEYYWAELKRTKIGIEKLVKEDGDMFSSFYYSSSW